ncbi:MAG: cbb3-type cytochrome oxidase maturation protein [Alphaproteobacteria bacterium]|jgi:cbb3-type cytochrome oxidase maturation protein
MLLKNYENKAMSIIYVLIPLAIIIVAIAIGVFFWAVKSNQFDDLERQGYSILFDDDVNQDSASAVNTNKDASNGKNNTHSPAHKSEK